MLNRAKVVLCIIICLGVFIAIQGGLTKEKELDWSSLSANENRYVLGEMTDGTKITQVIPTKEKKVISIGVCFANYGDRRNTGEINLSITDKSGNICGKKVVKANEIEDNEFLFVDIDEASKVNEYVLDIQVSGSETGKAVSIWTRENDLMKENGGILVVNGETFSNQIEIILNYEVIAWEKIILALVCSLMLIYFLREC